jgi:hypothetical protein
MRTVAAAGDVFQRGAEAVKKAVQGVWATGKEAVGRVASAGADIAGTATTAGGAAVGAAAGAVGTAGAAALESASTLAQFKPVEAGEALVKGASKTATDVLGATKDVLGAGVDIAKQAAEGTIETATGVVKGGVDVAKTAVGDVLKTGEAAAGVVTAPFAGDIDSSTGSSESISEESTSSDASEVAEDDSGEITNAFVNVAAPRKTPVAADDTTKMIKDTETLAAQAVKVLGDEKQ